VVPVELGVGLWPGRSPYEDLVAPLRGDRLDVYGLTLPFGVVPESTLLCAPEVLAVGGSVNDKQTYQIASVRTRAWLERDGLRYGVIAVLAYGPMMGIWTRAVRGRGKRIEVPRAADRVQLLPVHRRFGFRGTMLRRRLAKVCS